MQLKAPKTRNMASLKDEEQAATTSSSNNNNTNNVNNNHSTSNNANEDEPKVKRESLEARKQVLEQRLSEKSWLLQQIQKQESAIINGNYEQMTINEFFSQLAQQYKHEQQLPALTKESSSILRRKQSTTSRESRESQQTSSNSINNNILQSETMSNRSSEYDNYQPAGGVGDMLVIGVAQQQAQQQHQMVKSALKKRPTPTPSQMQYMRQQQSHHLMMPYQRSQPDVISMYSANSSNVATLRHPPQASPQQQSIIVHCDKYYLSPTHQSYNECGFIKSSQNIKKYVSPLASPSNHSYEQHVPHNHPQHRQLDAISLAPSYASVDMEAQQQQQQRWRSQSHIAPLTPPQLGIIEVKSHSSDMLAAPLPSRYQLHDEISLSSSSTTIEKKAKPKQWLESSLDGPAVIRQIDSQPQSPAGSSSNGSYSQAASATKPRTKLSSQSMSVSGTGVGRHFSMSNQRPVQNHPSASYAVSSSSKALLSQSTSYLNAMEQTMGISISYPLEPLEIPPFRQLPPKPNQMQQTPPPRPPPVQQNHNNGSGFGSAIQTALVSPPLTVATASLSPDIRIESPKNMTVVQQATFQPYKEVTKPFEMSDFYKYSTKFKQKEVGRAHV
ncbi:bromodomain-containing protein DDB_G0280777 isoform X1 [Drosophila guanche]|uniref:bromodomain-containing protein DDB_G0280777 isoform X1 n=1 Tax=Drosophila guanche TaxID=7266 RepID=UPI0014721EA5|nr:bromodomain-containing protein DDB_G0280777 isoform X1 [Drosophila guanche]XP_034122460.1 bromodomain-containing protein DDB_G0280777 isoform X1 [Drosophila guanche]XP_034122461.1 bromodomain-containing protein DDB_G0280777 isoform X1 [Drosophila guanche]XP_034122462.1 bromodomain-containing protein DDB_G0280777 isoform X1 [Drosophila guanche]